MFYKAEVLDTALAEMNRNLGVKNEDGIFNYVYPIITENIAGYLKFANNLC